MGLGNVISKAIGQGLQNTAPIKAEVLLNGRKFQVISLDKNPLPGDLCLCDRQWVQATVKSNLFGAAAFSFLIGAVGICFSAVFIPERAPSVLVGVIVSCVASIWMANKYESNITIS